MTVASHRIVAMTLFRSRSAGNGILFVSHDAWRTGAPIVLLHFLRWLKANTRIPFIVLLREGVGQLREEFEKLGPVFAWNELPATGPEVPEPRWSWRTAVAKAIGKSAPGTVSRPTSRAQFAAFLAEQRIGLIYSNTITNGEVLAALASPSTPVLTHVHELGYWITHRMDPANVEQNRRHTQRFVAVSHAVRDNLVTAVSIPPHRIDVIYGFIPPDTGSIATPAQIRQQLGIPMDAFVVAASGTTDWRKSPDLFIQLAAVMRRLRPQQTPHFLWVGGENQGPSFAALSHDIERTDVADRVHFVGLQQHPLDFFRAADVFAMVSREDPFPLVCLEAASLGKPIVCFDRAGGMREFVNDDAGVVVPYLDIDSMAAAIFRLMDDVSLRQRLGACAAHRVSTSHQVDVIAPRLLESIRKVQPAIA